MGREKVEEKEVEVHELERTPFTVKDQAATEETKPHPSLPPISSPLPSPRALEASAFPSSQERD